MDLTCGWRKCVLFTSDIGLDNGVYDLDLKNHW
jgi:hypothetical protein